MIIVLLHNYFSPKALIEVMEEMKIKGPPTIRAYDLGFDDLYQAVEGSHRLRACEHLRVIPEIELVDPSDTVGDLGLDYDADPDTEVKELGDWENYSIDLDDIDANLRDDEDDEDEDEDEDE